MELRIEPVGKDNLASYLHFFDNMVFPEHPHWDTCYCYTFHFTGADEEWTKERNRLKVSDLIREGKLRGYLAFSGEIPVGWCNVNDKGNFQRLKAMEEYWGDDEEGVAAIVCFVVGLDHRHRGVATALLDRIVADYSDGDYRYLEAYPQGGLESDEENFKGPLSLYRKAGFQEYRSLKDRMIYRKKL